MEQLRADLRRVQNEFNILRSKATSVFQSLSAQQGAQPRLRTTRQRTAHLQVRVPGTETLERSLLDAYSEFQRHLEELDKKIENALSSANASPWADSGIRGISPGNTSPNTDALACDASSSADSPIIGDTPPCADAPRTGNTSHDASAPPARETRRGADFPLIGGASPSAGPPPNARLSPSADPPPSANSSPRAEFPSTSGTTRTTLPSAQRPAQPPGGRLGDDKGRADSLGVLPGPPPESSPNDPGQDNALKPAFTLKLTDLGGCLIPKLQTCIESDNFNGKLSVDVGLSFAALVEGVRLDNPGFDTRFEVRHRLAGDVWHLYTHPVEEFKLPDLTEFAKPPEDVEQHLEHLYQDLPREPIPYHVGPLSGPTADWLQSYFPSGHEVSQLGHVPGVSSSMDMLVEKDQGPPSIAKMSTSARTTLQLLDGKSGS
ncbi:hypothetical protein VTI74DRAFT_1970 [Chaetomium olivicolor]